MKKWCSENWKLTLHLWLSIKFHYHNLKYQFVPFSHHEFILPLQFALVCVRRRYQNCVQFCVRAKNTSNTHNFRHEISPSTGNAGELNWCVDKSIIRSQFGINISSSVLFPQLDVFFPCRRFSIPVPCKTFFCLSEFLTIVSMSVQCFLMYNMYSNPKG